MRMLIALTIVIAAAAHAEPELAATTYPRLDIGEASSGHHVISFPSMTSPTFESWPSTCHLVLNDRGDLSIVGPDVTPCAERLETAARLARAAQRVNRRRPR